MRQAPPLHPSLASDIDIALSPERQLHLQTQRALALYLFDNKNY